MEATMIGFAVGIAVGISVVLAAAIFTILDVFLALKTAKAAPGRKPGYFNIGYRPGYGTELCRAHLVGAAERIGNVMMYIVEIHPRGRSQSARVDCPGSRAMRKAVTEERKIL